MDDVTTYTQSINLSRNKPSVKNEKNLSSKGAILIVEDNMIAQMVTKKMIEQFDCVVDIAQNGQDALVLWHENHYDLIFMDIGLPDINGDEVTQRIRKVEGTSTSTPIVALTAQEGEDNKKRYLESGMNAVLYKPLTFSMCVDVLNRFGLSISKQNTAPSTLISPND